MIALMHQRSCATLAASLNEGLEEVDIEPKRSRTGAGARLRRPARSIARYPATPHHRAVLLFDPGLIVLVIGAGAGPFDAVLLAVTLQRLMFT